MTVPRRLPEPLGLVLPFLLWGLGFVLLYALHGFACALGLAPGVTRTALALSFLLHLAAQAALAFAFRRRLAAASEADRFVRRVAFLTALAAFAAAAWTGAPVLFLSICS